MMDEKMMTPLESLQLEYDRALKDVESYKSVLVEQRDVHKKEIGKLYNEIGDLKEQLALDRCAFSLLNVLRNNGDTIVVAEREAKVIAEGVKDLSDRSETLYLHLSLIAKDICQKLDDVQTGLSKRNISGLPEPDDITRSSAPMSSMSNIHELMEEKAYLAEQLEDTVHRLQQAEARNAQLEESFEEMNERLHTYTELTQENSVFAPHNDSNNIVDIFREETGLMRKENLKNFLILSVRQGALKPQEAFVQFQEAGLLGDITLENLITMAPKKKKTPMKVFRRMFATKSPEKTTSQINFCDN